MKNQIHSDPFSARIQTIEALQAIAKNEESPYDLKKLAAELDSLSVSLSSTAAASAYAALAGLLRIVDGLVLWRGAVLGAEVDADRYLRSSKERFDLWATEHTHSDAAEDLLSAASGIGSASKISDVSRVAEALVTVPMPLGVFEHPPKPSWALNRKSAEQTEKEPVDLTVAFLKFQIDGTPAADIHQVAPSQVHDLEIEVRVSRWPLGKHELRLTPVSIEPKATYDFPLFSFKKPEGEAPYTLQQTGRAALLLPQGMHARPFEFKYTAEFLPEKGDQPVSIVGHRTLIIDGTEPEKHHLSGYPTMDRRLFAIRDFLRRRGGVPQAEAADALLILTPLCNLAGRAVQDAELRGKWTEAEFQALVRGELRRHPPVGADLDEHAKGAGGFTDLSLRGMPVELKVQDSTIKSLDDCQRFFAQTESYAVAKSKRTAILCVLDFSEKKSAPLPAEALLDIRVQPDSGVALCVLVIQANLARPSALSR